MVVVGIIVHYLLQHTRSGRYLYPTGSNAEAARRQGINLNRVTILAYVLSSGLATLAGILMVSRLSIASPSMANAYEPQAIAAAVVGGAGLFGGRGTVLGAIAGAILFTTMSNGAVLLSVDPFWEMVIEGLLIALVVYLDNLQKGASNGVLMETLVCTAPGRLVLEDRSEPASSSSEVLVRVRSVGICGTDYHIYEGNQPFLSYPRVMGHELAVEVVCNDTGTGPSVGEMCVVNPYLSCGYCIACRKGKPNCCVNIAVLGVHRDGGMTQLLSLPPGNLLAGNGLSAEQCAMVEFLAIGAHAVRRAVVTPGERVLVIGAGPIGLGAALFASLSGGEVTLLDRDADRVKLGEPLVHPTRTLVADDRVVETLAGVTGGEWFDVVFDATGSSRSMEAGFSYVSHGGRYTFISIVQGQLSFSDSEFHKRETTLLASRNATAVDFEGVLQAFHDGAIDADAWITHRTSLAGAVDHLPQWAASKTGLIKGMIQIGG